VNYDQAIENYLKIISERVNIRWQAYNFTIPKPTFIVSKGRVRDKIVQVDSSRSVHSFVDKTTGDIYKAASWNAPAKHARGNIYDRVDEAFGFDYDIRYL